MPSPQENSLEENKELKEITEEALRWVRNNQGKELRGEYTSPRISSEIPDCSMPCTFDSYKFCSLGCNYCVISGTYISAEGGRKKIENIKIGDRVHSYNIETKKVELDVVVNTMQRKTNELLEIELETGAQITITPEHPVYVNGKGWVEAKDLKEDDDVILIKKPGNSLHKTEHNPMKNKATAQKMGRSMKASFASGKLDWLKEKISKQATIKITKYNKSKSCIDKVAARMKKNNPMKRKEVADKVGAKNAQTLGFRTNGRASKARSVCKMERRPKPNEESGNKKVKFTKDRKILDKKG